ncbi:phosphatidate cytidylyltransferase [Palleronia caenipelagi]|uniref:Phosphatidate cytidylyltransferase n=1 Tax=Palleronia caenipelagi TaxID=2489174 RepID=A0A547Q635_9RHOB|nr:phosphatidate cytidylyltransferase [Palleronia caenipelagi]TRD21849.1 phosphatidate cytidylyltransferase [Palleronia caenipelagi]
MSSAGRWGDLGERLGVGAAMAVVALICVWVGGWLFTAMTVGICAVITWELVRMLDPEAPAMRLGIVVGLALAAESVLPTGYALLLLAVPVFYGVATINEHRLTYALYATLIQLAGLGLIFLRLDDGITWMLWLALVVIVTDVFGYVFGRLIGGPKMWTRVSPNKTWSGTIAGWIGAAVVGGVFAAILGVTSELVPISIVLSMAGQVGDVAESAVKRRAGVKDSSALLPGHGGLFDRFDGMLGASVLLLLITPLIGFPFPVAG